MARVRVGDGAGGKTARRAGKAVDKKAIAGRGTGIKKMRRNADRSVREACVKLTETLKEKALGGNVGSARLLLQLAEQYEPAVRTRAPEERKLSIADLFSVQPEWVEPEDRGPDYEENWDLNDRRIATDVMETLDKLRGIRRKWNETGHV